MSSLCFSLPLRLLLRLFRQTFVGCSLVFILVSVSGVFFLPSSFCMDSFRFLCWGVSFTPSFLRFSFRSAVLDYLLLFTYLSFAILPYSSVGFFAVSFLSSGFLPSGYLSPSPYVFPRMFSSDFVLTVFVPSLSFVLFFSLVRPHRIACFVLGPFLRFLVTGLSFLVPPLLSLSLHLVFLVLFLGVFLGFLVLSLLRVGLSSSSFCQSFVLPLRLPRFHSLAPFAFVPSVVVGDLPDVLLCACSCPSGFLIGSFSYFFPPSLSLCLSSFSCPFSFSDLFPFLSWTYLLFFSLWGIQFFLYPGFPFGSCFGYTFPYFSC